LEAYTAVIDEPNVLYTDHAEFMHQVPDEYLADVMPIAKKIAAAGGFAQYNVLQVRSHISGCTFTLSPL
jgi:predicted house-cleaning noncanonical NTP pyrophosphatase (MazG superfamily)